MRQERMERSGGGARIRRRERSLGKSTFIEKRGISSVFSPILEKRAPVLSFAEVVKKGSLSSVPCAANSKEGAEKDKFWIAKPRAPSSLGTHTLVQLTRRKLFSFSVPFHRKLLSILSSHINFFNDMGLLSHFLESS